MWKPLFHHNEGEYEKLYGAEYSPLWFARRRHGLMWSGMRREACLLLSRLAFDSRMLTRYASFNLIPIYAPDFVMTNPTTASVDYGLDSSEFDFAIVDDLLMGRAVRCRHNRAGRCRSILAGHACNDGEDPDASNHPCGFFDHRRDIRDIIQGVKPPSNKG